MKRLALALAAAVLVALAASTSVVDAELENQLFTSRPHRLRLVVPRGWRATEQPSYPGMLLWMLRGQPEGKMVLTAEPFTRKVYCSWPPACRASSDPLPTKLACSLRQKLETQRLRVGPVQAGPKENEQAGMPSVWYELDDGKHFVRQAVAVGEDRVVSLTLTAPSAQARSAHVRAFEQALRTLRPLTPEELGIAQPPAERLATPQALDAGVADAAVPADAASPEKTFESAPAPSVDPVGPCGGG